MPKSYNKDKDEKKWGAEILGAKDSITHEYMKQPEQFADVFNGALFKGE